MKAAWAAAWQIIETNANELSGSETLRERMTTMSQALAALPQGEALQAKEYAKTMLDDAVSKTPGTYRPWCLGILQELGDPDYLALSPQHVHINVKEVLDKRIQEIREQGGPSAKNKRQSLVNTHDVDWKEMSNQRRQRQGLERLQCLTRPRKRKSRTEEGEQVVGQPQAPPASPGVERGGAQGSDCQAHEPTVGGGDDQNRDLLDDLFAEFNEPSGASAVNSNGPVDDGQDHVYGNASSSSSSHEPPSRLRPRERSRSRSCPSSGRKKQKAAEEPQLLESEASMPASEQPQLLQPEALMPASTQPGQNGPQGAALPGAEKGVEEGVKIVKQEVPAEPSVEAKSRQIKRLKKSVNKHHVRWKYRLEKSKVLQAANEKLEQEKLKLQELLEAKDKEKDLAEAQCRKLEAHNRELRMRIEQKDKREKQIQLLLSPQEAEEVWYECSDPAAEEATGGDGQKAAH
eukprot:CAMPEP_0178434298 /NCGR_PEP_ID=MMETSP0689_2-20121128/33352_1 /TAXON_ID=160604 /ORGANISM="Amphidinium massartii, Strain CS-259" /LENGTH=460 /DNA_ID=CAMNT_0020056359 /DNA_START=238 /DNA_END=1621 /DNA_ORIENTATION=+